MLEVFGDIAVRNEARCHGMDGLFALKRHFVDFEEIGFDEALEVCTQRATALLGLEIVYHVPNLQAICFAGDNAYEICWGAVIRVNRYGADE